MTRDEREARARAAILDAKLHFSSWAKFGDEFGVPGAYLYQIAHGTRRPSARIIKRLGIAPQDRGIRIRLTVDDARRIMNGEVPWWIRARVAGAVAVKECGSE